jgi:hypothetical protein
VLRGTRLRLQHKVVLKIILLRTDGFLFIIRGKKGQGKGSWCTLRYHRRICKQKLSTRWVDILGTVSKSRTKAGTRKIGSTQLLLSELKCYTETLTHSHTHTHTHTHTQSHLLMKRSCLFYLDIENNILVQYVKIYIYIYIYIYIKICFL